MKPNSTIPSKIQINKPCNQNWDAMGLTANGRYCEACNKEVIDYRDKTPSEIATMMARPGASTCGRFRKSQIGLPLPVPEIPRPPRFQWLGWQTAAAAAMLALWQFPNAAYTQATIRPTVPTSQFGPEPPKPLGNTLVSLVILDHAGNNLSNDVVVTFVLPGGMEKAVRSRRGFVSIDLGKKAVPKDMIGVMIKQQKFGTDATERIYSLREQSIALHSAQNWVIQTRVEGNGANQDYNGDDMGDMLAPGE